MIALTTTITITKEISTQQFIHDMQRVKWWADHKKKCQEDEHRKGTKQAQDTLYRLGQKYGMTVEEIIKFAKQY